MQQNVGVDREQFQSRLHCRPRYPYFLLISGPMRPQATPLARATCRNPRILRRAPCGARGFAAVTQTTLLHIETRRPTLSSQRSESSSQQKKCITQAYIQRMKDGKKEWAEHAEEIRAGKRKNFAAHLEERGLIHDVVGYVSHSFVGSRPLQSAELFLGSGADFLPAAENENCCTKSSRRSEPESTSESTLLHPRCTSDTCCLSWY